MKRESNVERYPNALFGEIWKHFGLFAWKECFFCKMEFRREDGYRFLLRANSAWLYSCERCCCSKSHCNDMIGHWMANARKTSKELPVPPPMRSYKND